MKRNYQSQFNLFQLLLLISLLTFRFTPAVAQQDSLYFYSISTDKGLSHQKVNAIFQDSRGFMWFGTEDGLNRYDGRYFVTFNTAVGNKASISGNIITGILEDKEQILWVSTREGGLSRYDYKQPATKQFKQYRHDESNKYSIPENRINFIVDDHKGYLWLATSRSHIVRFNKKTERFELPVAVGSRGISSLYLDEKGILWVEKIGGGVVKINTATLTHEDNPDERIFSSSIFPKAKGFVKDQTKLFAEDLAGNLWMTGMENSGLTVYHKKTGRSASFFYDPLKEGSIINNHVNTIYVDRAGRVWLGTNNGVSVFNPLYQPFEKTYLPVKNRDAIVYDFYADTNKRLWIGTSDGIFIKDLISGKFEHRKLSYKGVPVAVTKFFVDLDGTFYLGTDYTLFIYNTKNNSLSTLPNTEEDPVMKRIDDSKIVSVVRDTIDSHPVLIASPYGHYLTYYDFVDKAWVSKEHGTKKIVAEFNLKDDMIRKLHKSADGNIWVATAKYGLGNWNPGRSAKMKYQRRNADTSVSLNDDDIFDVLEGDTGTLWVSTYGGGLKVFSPSTQQVLHVKESSNLSEGIQTDSAGNLWIVCNGHMHKYNAKSTEYTCYKPPGLQNDIGLSGYIYKDIAGKLYVGGTNYYMNFNPAKVSAIDHSPDVYFTDFKIFDTSFNELLLQKSIELQYDQKYFSVEFSAPEFNGDNIQYAYMLEGMDKNWIKSGTRNYAVYANLPAGKYTFKVKAGNWQGIFGNNVKEIEITILAPFWLSTWFYVLVTMCGIGIAAFLYVYRIKELLRRQEVRNHIALDLHDNIGSTLSSISVYSQVAKIYQQQQNNYQLIQVLDSIGDTASEMIGEMGDIVWAINPKNDHLSSIYSRMESYAKPVCKAKNVGFDLHPDPKVPFLKLDMNVRKNIYLIFKEAINNSLKYAECTAIEVKLYLKDGVLILSIYDNGIGFDQQVGSKANQDSLSGNGIRNIGMRAKEINAQLHIFSKKNGLGTLIEVFYRIP